MSLPIVELTGSAYEQGVQHGRQLRQRIHHNLDVYFDRFKQDSRLSRAEVLHRASLYLPAIAAQNGDYRDGMLGIAEGSGSSVEEIAALNVRYEIIYYQAMSNALAAARDGCTSFAVARARTSSGHLLIGQNWDWIPHVLGAVLHTTAADGFQTLAFTEAGIFGGKIGVNSAGLGLCVNGISSLADDWERLSKPFHLRCYEILGQWRFAEAVEVVTRTPRACSANFLIAQSPDQVLDMEAAPDSVYHLGLEGGCLVHTNHFVAPEELGISEPPSERRHLSCNRLDRMSALLCSKSPVSLEDIQSHLQDHSTAPGAICRHEDPETPVSEQFRTVASMIIDLDERTLHISDGPPCGSGYDLHALN
jgi:isopenicillin-N N-acyltransferase-like protein